MSRPFLAKYEYAWEYEYPFGMDFLKSIFGDNYTRKYSKTGEGIFNIIQIDNKIYDISFKKNATMLSNDGKKAFRDETKDKVIEMITNKFNENNIEYAINSGKYITFKYNGFTFKLEIVKKAVMPQ